ncbi:MAG: hypothetical protein ACXWLM_05970, partial [Myxococcales bacterium]
HELSHLWNVPDLDQPSPRWNEGLAMWLQYRIARELDGFAGTDAAAARIRKRLCEAVAKDARLREVPMRRYGEKDMTDYAYLTGFLMFQELDARMGTKSLDSAIRDWFQQHRRGATSEDLRGALGQPALWLKWMTTTEWIAGC